MLSKVLSFFIILLLTTSITAHSQDKRDIGLQVGGTYYYGDFNESKPMYNSSASLGVLFRYNINNHYSIRASALYGRIAGNYTEISYLPGVTASSFSKSLLDAQIMGEFNFINFNPVNTRKVKISPFVNLGFGVSQIGGSITPNIPFGLGFKITPGQRHTISCEWRFHKTFTDFIDNYSAPKDKRSVFIHNNDWISFMGVTYTYRLFNNNNICPVYK